MKRIQKTALAVTRWVGSPISVVIHTILFIGSFLAVHFNFVQFEEMLLILTTIVSLEAIYLAIFIQMTVNRHTVDIEEIHEEVEELGEEVEDIGEGVEEISEDIQTEEAVEEIEERQKEITFEKIEGSLQKLMVDIETLKNEVRKS